MANKLTTPTQIAVSDTMFDLVDSHQTFAKNNGEAVSRLRRSIVEQVTITTAAGLVLGALIGTAAGRRR
jgi:hypothetical protein